LSEKGGNLKSRVQKPSLERGRLDRLVAKRGRGSAYGKMGKTGPKDSTTELSWVGILYQQSLRYRPLMIYWGNSKKSGGTNLIV